MRRRLVRTASAIWMTLGVGHLTLAVLIDRTRVADWLDEGLWAAVPLGAAETVEAQANATAFWGGVGSFAVPLAVLSGLLWRLAGREVPVPAWVGWTMAGWCALGGVLLVPSPYFVGMIPGLLIVLASRHRESECDTPSRKLLFTRRVSH